MNKINYQLELDREIDEIKKQGRVPSLLLHSCCGPCSSYVLEYLTKYFDVTVLYFNPNIYPAEEYEHRLSEQRRIISLLPAEHNVKMLECEYNHTQFTDAAKGYEQEREGGSRCEKCFYLRLERTAQEAKEHGFDYFTTTLSVIRTRIRRYSTASAKRWAKNTECAICPQISRNARATSAR